LKIHNFLTEENIVLDMKSKDREGILKEMVDFLKKKELIEREKELYEKLLQREQLGSTAIGDGVAIPHCKWKGTKNPVVLLALSKAGIDFHSLDGNPSFIFFLVVSSPDNPSLNLQILAAIAHLVRKSGSLLKKILEAKDVSTIQEIIREGEENIDE
jgi:mannitol/fructose-specific phosphotransferase system IIA component (Ntr-type)